MSQILGLVTQMYGNKGVTNRSVDNGTFQIVDSDPQNILEPLIDGGYLCSDLGYFC